MDPGPEGSAKPPPAGASHPLAGADFDKDGDGVAAAKAAIRAKMRSRRAGLDADSLAAAGAAVSARLRALPAMRAAGLVAAYRAVRGEIPLEDLMDDPSGPADSPGDGPGGAADDPIGQAEGPPPGSDPAMVGSSGAPLDRIRYTLPRVRGRDLVFVVRQPGQPFEPGAFAIPEPVGGEVAALADHDVVLVPVVAFDADGYRVGQGQGFYDRALAALAAPRPGPGPVLIGVAHSFQQVDEAPRHPWDVALDAVVTESGLVEVAPRP